MFRLSSLPANLVNGLSVTVGLALVHFSLRPFLGNEALGAATNAALYASISHLVHRPGTAARRSLAGGLAGVSVACFLPLVADVPGLVHLGIGLVAFGAMQSLAWGQRAGPISFAAVLALVLSLARAPQLTLWQLVAWSCLGAALYAVWAWASNWVLAERYRTLAVAATFDAAGDLLRVRAEVLEQLDASASDTAPRWSQIDKEAQLSALIQAARELVFTNPHQTGRVPHALLLLRSIEVRDLILTSRLDLELLGDNKLAREIRRRLAHSVRTNAQGLDQAADALRAGSTRELSAVRGQSHVTALLDERNLSAQDPRIRLLPVIASRQQQLFDHVVLLHDLMRGRQTQVPLALEAPGLQSSESWPLREPLTQLRWQSPVFRHAVRSALALMSAYALASALPWATRPYWIVLSVAVVLRGNFAQTVARRNQRVLGTALGCGLAAGVVGLASESALLLAFFAAVGVAHAYVNVRYTLTATAATLMALLQTRLMTEVTPSLVAERLADTVIGAFFAWAFSFVLPAWASNTVPKLVERTLSTLRSYIEGALRLEVDATERQQLAREQTYEALETLSSTLRLSAAEPRRVRPRLTELLSFIDHAQRLMAHLSSLRLLLLRRREQLQGPETEAALLDARLRLREALELGASPVGVASQSRRAPPSTPPEQAALPWLLRRIELSIHEANLAGVEARAALAPASPGAERSADA